MCSERSLRNMESRNLGSHMNYDDQPLPPLSDWLLFAVLMAWKCAPVLLVVGVVTMLAVMVSPT